MNDPSALLGQLRIDRGPPPQKGGGGRGKWLLVVLCAVIPAAAALAALLLWPRGIPVHAVTVQADPGTPAAGGASLLDASGYVVARRQATVSAKITDKVMEIRIEEGQHVKGGEIVAVLDDTNVRAAFDQAVAQLGFARASLVQVQVELGNAERTLKRDRGLVAEHFISENDLDTAQTAYDNLAAQVESARRNVDVAVQGVAVEQRNLDDTIVRAPFDGVVTNKAAQPGEIVSPISAGGGFTRTGICTLVDMDSLEVEVDVNESFIHRVFAGQPATVRLNAYTDWQIPASVIAVIPSADRSKATVKVRVGLKQKDPRILPEMGARVAFLGAAADSGPAATPGLRVPVDAVQGSGDIGVVWVVHGETVEKRSVRLGARGPDGQTVLSGLSSGDRLVTGDLDQLTDGAQVRVVK